MENKTIKARRKAKEITLTKLQQVIVAAPDGRTRSLLRRDFRTRGLLGPIDRRRQE